MQVNGRVRWMRCTDWTSREGRAWRDACFQDGAGAHMHREMPISCTRTNTLGKKTWSVCWRIEPAPSSAKDSRYYRVPGNWFLLLLLRAIWLDRSACCRSSHATLAFGSAALALLGAQSFFAQNTGRSCKPCFFFLLFPSFVLSTAHVISSGFVRRGRTLAWHCPAGPWNGGGEIGSMISADLWGLLSFMAKRADYTVFSLFPYPFVH